MQSNNSHFDLHRLGPLHTFNFFTILLLHDICKYTLQYKFVCMDLNTHACTVYMYIHSLANTMP